VSKESTISFVEKNEDLGGNVEEYNTKNVLRAIQKYLPSTTRYTIDIGEFMSYVIHYMKVLDFATYDINVHFGAMGSGIGSAIGSKLAEPERPVVCITGDGCFYMHGMEILTAKEYNLPILFVVMNNARLGMVYHGHSLQFRRTHPTLEQEPINISAMAAAMNIPSFRINALEDINQSVINNLMDLNGPAILEVALIDNNTPPMGDRVKFLSSFGK
jgi:acetolactate synthase-1/2/3 large subunit